MAIYGASVMTSPTMETNYDSNAIGMNSAVFAVGDILTMDASNGLKVAGATTSVIGVSATSATMSATNQTVGLVKPAYIPVDQDTEFLMGTNSALSALTSIGAYYKITGTTGAMQVDVASGVQTTSSRVVVCTGVDPQGIGDPTQGLFKFVKIFNLRNDE